MKTTRRAGAGPGRKAPAILREVTFDGKGLVPAIVQDDRDGTVLMFAWMNREALRRTLAGPWAVFWSRSRGPLWLKGETSGYRMRVRTIRLDCDGDVVLLRVRESGAACHTGRRSCFFREVRHGRWHVLGRPVFDPKKVYGT